MYQIILALSFLPSPISSLEGRTTNAQEGGSPEVSPEPLRELSSAFEAISARCFYDGRVSCTNIQLDSASGEALLDELSAYVHSGLEIGDASFLQASRLHNKFCNAGSIEQGEVFDREFIYGASEGEVYFSSISGAGVRKSLLALPDQMLFYQSSFNQLQILDRKQGDASYFRSPNHVLAPLGTDGAGSCQWMRNGPWKDRAGSSEVSRVYSLKRTSGNVAENTLDVIWPLGLPGPRAAFSRTKWLKSGSEEWHCAVYRMRPMQVVGSGTLNVAEVIQFELEPDLGTISSRHFTLFGFSPLDNGTQVPLFQVGFRMDGRTTLTDRRKRIGLKEYGPLFEEWPNQVTERIFPL